MDRDNSSSAHSQYYATLIAPAQVANNSPNQTYSTDGNFTINEALNHMAATRSMGVPLRGKGPIQPKLLKTQRNVSYQNNRFFDELRDMWQRKQLCDIVVKVNKKSYYAHKIVLALKSEYFKGLLNTLTKIPSGTNCLKYSEGGHMPVITISEMTDFDMEALLRYCYTGDYSINSRNVQDTYVLADKYGFVELLNRCVQYIVGHIDVDNCISVLHFARQYSSQAIYQRALRFIWRNFPTISEQSSEFLLLNSASLVDLLRSEELNVRNEEKSFEAALRWIDYDPQSRVVCVLPLLQSIRLGLIDTKYFVEKIKQCKYIKDNPICRPLIRDTIRFLYDLRTIYDIKSRESLLQADGNNNNNPGGSVKKGGGGFKASRLGRHILAATRTRFRNNSPSAPSENRSRHRRTVFLLPPPPPQTRPTTSTAARTLGTIELEDEQDDLMELDANSGNVAAGTSKNFPSPLKAASLKRPNDKSGALIDRTAYYECGSAGSVDYCLNQGADNTIMAKPRLPHEIMFVVGGWSGGTPTNVVESYDTRADRWIRCERLEPREPRAYHGLIGLENKIYMIGGFNGDEYFNTCKVLDPTKIPVIPESDELSAPVTDPWTEIAPMHSPRCYVSVAVLDGYIYALGGFDGRARLNTAEKYDPSTNQWTPIMPMNYQRSDASATVHDGKIYIAGGFNGQECLAGAEYYEPASNTWTTIASMKFRRSGVGLVTLNDKIYALGGFNGISRMSSVERYDTNTFQWEPVLDMNHPRSNFASEVIDDMIYVIGGFNGVSTIYHVECFHDAVNEWYEATDMNLYRSALSACVLSDLPNRDAFIHKNRSALLEEKFNTLTKLSKYLVNTTTTLTGRNTNNNNNNAPNNPNGPRYIGINHNIPAILGPPE